MVIALSRRRTNGWLVAELMFALTVIVVAMIPLAFSFRAEQKLVRAHYNQVVAMEIIDGEMEILHAGDWRRFVEGEHPYQVTAEAVTNLPPGGFWLTRTAMVLRLEWKPEKKGRGGVVMREIRIQDSEQP